VVDPEPQDRDGTTMLGALEDFDAEQEYKGDGRATLTFYRQHFDHFVFVRDMGILELSEFIEERRLRLGGARRTNLRQILLPPPDDSEG
jgi:hypothetical protein